MRILITGGKGQLGLALQKALTTDEVLAPGHAELDITDAAAVRNAIRDFRPDVVIHAAAWTDTAACERDPARAMAVNADGARNVAAACRDANAAMLYVSSNEVFDGATSAPYPEDAPTNPLNAYARSKLAGEQAVQAATEHHCIIRTSWLYGPGRTSFPEKIIQVAQERRSLRVVTDEIASPTWTVDLAQAIAALVHTPAAHGVYHLTNARYCSRKEWAQEILRLARLDDIKIEASTQAEFGAPFRKPAFSALANVRAAAVGIELRPWQEALADHFRYTANNQHTVAQASARPKG